MNCDYILGSIATSSYAKNKLNIWLIMTTSVLIRSIIYCILCYVITINEYIDFLLHIMFSILLSMNSNIVYINLKQFNRYFYVFVDYIIDNYSIENFLRWRRICIFVSCTGILIYLYLFDITNKILTVCVLEYVISFVCIETIERNNLKRVLDDYINKPSTKIDQDINILDLYVEIKQQRELRSTPVVRRKKYKINIIEPYYT